MTILIGYKMTDRVLFVADRLRVKVNDLGAVTAPKNSDVDKIRIIRPSIAIATAGLGTLSDAAVMAIRTFITDPINTPNYSLHDVIECCQEHFRYVYNQFKKYNPNLYHPMLFLLGGTDPHSKKPFLFSFEGDLNFNKSEDLDWIVRGPHVEEEKVKFTIRTQLHSIQKLGITEIDSASYLALFTNAIKSAAVGSDSVGTDCLGMMVGDFPAKKALL